MVRPGHPSPKRTKHQKRMAEYEERAYQLLRSYQDGDFNAKSGVVAGQLDVALTTVLDRLKEHANEVFAHAR